MLTIMSHVFDAVFPAPLPPPIDGPTRADLVIDSLKSAIVSGRLKPGQILVERKIAEQLGVSKTPVREAFIVLERSGLLAVEARRITVRSLSFTDIRHIYEERVLLEPWAIVDAARFDSRFSVAGRALVDARAHADSNDKAAEAMANRRFHRGMYASSENEFIVNSLDGLQDLTALAVAGVLWERWPRREIEAGEHEAIYDAARSGDAITAAQLMREHIAASIVRVSRSEVGH
ncbi:GntR family transcriptional regulator [Cryobacterium luteum]|uniref:GntR family transcriptional regulator n=2 Tax=Cryobacterium luteum TaxID=1424661 RepID=A0A1H8BXS7_9MICO|nr:GntR family transcriptional regulator [Cryobacterium luteum]TFB89170.1 GntR family transcriptional regulator [Cryobacterium luteum]SEM87532.1 transcriptional regulator, GntR family [Cryobacterium luteum]